MRRTRGYMERTGEGKRKTWRRGSRHRERRREKKRTP
jgi:hypothetical protein